MAGSGLLLATGVAAQDACDLLQSRSSRVQLTGDGFFNFISDPVFGCEGGVVIRADSAVLDDVSGYTRFIGNFEYRDSTAFMTADRADHFASAGQLIGVGDVHIIDGATGATFEGDSTVLVGSSSRREDGEMTIMGRDGRRAHAVILVSPGAAAPNSAETPPNSNGMESDSAEVADSSEARSESAATESDSARAENPAETSDSAADDPEVSATQPDSAEISAPTPDPPPPDTTPVPYDIDAERIHLSGADHMLATGNAELYNDEFRALADSIEYREDAGKLFLRGTEPRVLGYGAEYVLSGDAVDLDMDGDQVTARGDAALSGSEIDLTAPEIRVLMKDGVLDRIVAMNEQPEPELPGLPGGGGGAFGDSATATVAAAGETAGGATTEDAGESSVDGGTTDADTEPVEQASGDARTEPAEPAPAEATPSGDVLARGEGDAPRDTGGETGDSATAPPPARPRAVAETFELEGDSIDVLAPGEVLERVVAVGNARGESLARDSLNTEDTPEIARSDWVSGDTIIAVFMPAPADTETEAAAELAAGEPAGGYQLDRLVARGEAASLYRITPSGGGEGGEGEGAEEGAGEGEGEEREPDPSQPNAGDPDLAEAVAGEELPGEALREAGAEEGAGGPEPARESGGEEAAAEPEPDDRLALHYVRGDLITIFMRDGEVTSVIVEGNAQGVQLEPLAPSRPDTTAASPAARR